MPKIFASYTLSGCKKKVTLGGGIGDTRWVCWTHKNEIEVAKDYDGKDRSVDNICAAMWYGICYDLINVKLCKNYDRAFLSAYSGLLYQAIVTLKVDNQYCGGFLLGTIKWTIKPDDKTCKRDSINGRCTPGDYSVILKLQDLCDDVIAETIFHEIGHAIMYHMGYEEHEMNSETLINVMAGYLLEIFTTFSDKKLIGCLNFRRP